MHVCSHLNIQVLRINVQSLRIFERQNQFLPLFQFQLKFPITLTVIIIMFYKNIFVIFYANTYELYLALFASLTVSYLTKQGLLKNRACLKKIFEDFFNFWQGGTKVLPTLNVMAQNARQKTKKLA